MILGKQHAALDLFSALFAHVIGLKNNAYRPLNYRQR